MIAQPSINAVAVQLSPWPILMQAQHWLIYCVPGWHDTGKRRRDVTHHNLTVNIDNVVCVLSVSATTPYT